LRAENGHVCVIVERNVLGAPPEQAGLRAVEHQADDGAEGGRPRVARPDGARRPIEVRDPRFHLGALRRLPMRHRRTVPLRSKSALAVVTRAQLVHWLAERLFVTHGDSALSSSAELHGLVRNTSKPAEAARLFASASLYPVRATRRIHRP